MLGRLLALLLALPLSCAAALVEEQFDLPVAVRDAYGRYIAREVRVTVFRDDSAEGPRPLAIVLHGRAPDPRFPEASRWLVQRDFVVAIPTSIGYGVRGGEDAEDVPGTCDARRFEPGLDAAAAHALAVLPAMRARSDVDPDGGVLLGVSIGGAAALSLAALAPPCLAAVIDFSGGAGGHPELRSGRPCSPQLLERLFARYGSGAKLPTLWLYAQNDLYFSAEHPRRCFEAFRAAGAQAEFVQFPPAGEDGHRLFSGFPELWQPAVVEFLARHGLGRGPGTKR